jgi:ubiquinone/menaquinone biosynthesis C-methylase UbiE
MAIRDAASEEEPEANKKMVAGYERENRLNFNDNVANYDRYRPDYPAELFEDIFSYYGPAKNKKALEVGAGTGKASAPFLKAGYDLTAVEIGANMADVLRERYKDYSNFEVIVAPFEDVLLKEDNYDLIYAATAFHWIDAEVGCPKAFRLLKSGGGFALFRYNNVPADGESYYEEIQELYKKYYHKPYKRPIKVTREGYRTPTQIYMGFRFEDMRAYGFTDIIMNFYDAERTFDAKE